MDQGPSPWMTPATNGARDVDVPAPGEIFHYVVRATDGIRESAD